MGNRKKSLRNLCAFKTDEKSPEIIRITDNRTLTDALRTYPQHIILGAGSNTLFISDVNVPVFINAFRGLEVIYEDDATLLVTVGGGECWADLVRVFCAQSLWGTQYLAGIPGTVGAAPVKNIGAYGSELSDICHSIGVYDIHMRAFRTLYAGECGFAYRSSVFSKYSGRYIITHITLILQKDHRNPKEEFVHYTEGRAVKDPPWFTPTAIAGEILRTRKRKLPSVQETPNAGSFFKNPVISKTKATELCRAHPGLLSWKTENGVKFSAGQMVELCGLKGHIDPSGAAVSRKHALVIVNKGTDRGADIYAFSQKVQEKVNDTFGVHLEREVVVHGNGINE